MTRDEWARNILLDEYFKEMLEELEQIEIDKFSNSDVNDYDVREQAFVKLNALKSIKAHIESLAATKIINEKRFKIW